MPRKPKNNEPFNQNEYINSWKKENMGVVKASFKKDFVTEFKDACKILGIKQSDVIRKAMQETIEEARKSNLNT